MTADRRRRPVGLRREALILLPLAFFLLVVVSAFTLFSYRDGIALLVEDRRGEALQLARRIAATAVGGAPDEPDLRQAAPMARGVAVIDAGGRTVARTGTLPAAGLLTPPGNTPAAAEEFALGPGGAVGDSVVAFAPVPGGAGGWVRVDLGASALALQQRGLGVLTWTVVSLDVALVVLLVLFLGRMLEPFEALLERARSAGQVPPDSEDEVTFLVATFERALVALTRPPEPEGESAQEILQRTLAASFESGVLLLDRDGAVLAVNRAAAQLLEVPALEVESIERNTGRSLEEILGPYPELRRLLLDAVAGQAGVRRREIEVTAPSGRTLALGLTVHPLRRSEPGEGREPEEPGTGRPRGYLVLFVDLTEIRKQAEQASLAESLRQIGELTAGVAHELRNSLATMKGYLTLIERTRPADEAEGPAAGATAEYLAEIRRESDHLQRVLEDFLSFARPGTVRLERVDLHQVLARAATDPLLASAIVRLSPPPAEGLRMAGDPQLLERAFRNLLHNAVQASSDIASGDGPVEVEATAARKEDALEVTVADRGRGIEDGLKERLFQPFATGRPGGVGLGLALARRIVVLHGGRLEIEDRPGGGSVARATLPPGGIVTEGNEEEGAEAGMNPSHARGRRG